MAQPFIKTDLQDFEQLVKNLNEASRAAYPLAVRKTLDRMAFETSQKAKKETLPKEFNLRNNFIQKSVRYERCNNTFDIKQMNARAGQADSFAGKKTDQLKKQEFGQSIVSKGKYTKAATPSARAGSYSKKVTSAKRMDRMQVTNLKNVVNHATKNQAMQLKQACAVRKRGKVLQGKNFNVIATNAKGKRGIWAIKSGRKATLLYAFTHKTTHIKRTRWLEPTAKSIRNNAEKYFMQEGAARLEKTLAKGLKH